MYDYIMHMWIMNVITTDDLTRFVIDGWITPEQSTAIQSTERIEGLQ